MRSLRYNFFKWEKLGGLTITFCLLLALDVIAQTRSSPFAPPKESDNTFVEDDGPGLDTGCSFRGAGPLIIELKIDRFVGPVKSDGTLQDPGKLIRNQIISEVATLRMQVFDVDFEIPPVLAADGILPERDAILFNGKPIKGVSENFLTGSNNVWKENQFVVPINIIKFPEKGSPGSPPTPAINIIQINIDQLNIGNFIGEGPVTETPYFTEEFWCTAIDWVALTFKAWRPVLFVHGILSKPAVWANPWEKKLDDIDIETKAIDVGKLASIQSNGQLVGNAVSQLRETYGVDKVRIVSHSKGGLDSREYIQSNDDVEKLVMIATPNAGSPVADYVQGILIRLVGPIPTAILDLLLPASYQLTTKYMALYNLFYRPNFKTQHITIAGNHDPGGLCAGACYLFGEDDLVVPVSSVHALAFASNLKYTANDGSAIHTNINQALGVFNMLFNSVSVPSSPGSMTQPTILTKSRDSLPNVLLASNSRNERWVPRSMRTVQSDWRGSNYLFQLEGSGFSVEQRNPDLQNTASQVGFVFNGATNTHIMTIESGDEVFLQVMWGIDELDLELIDPFGNRIDPTVAETDPNIEHTVFEDFIGLKLEGYHILNPPAGNWTFEVTGTNVTSPDGEGYGVGAFIVGSSISLSAATNFDFYRINEPIEISATIADNSTPVTDAIVTAQVLLPDTTIEQVTLFDDGTHGDPVANDGQYFNIHTNTSQSGVYRILITARRTIGNVFSRENTILVTVSSGLSEFNDSFGDAGFDRNGDTLFDELRLQMGIDIGADGDYSIKGELIDSGGNLIEVLSMDTSLTVGTHTLELAYDGLTIFQNGISGPYTLEQLSLIEIGSNDVFLTDFIPVAHTTNAYDVNEFQRPNIFLTGSNTDFGTDTDGDGLFDFLDVEFEVNLSKSDSYSWSALLVDNTGSEIDFTTNSGSLTNGVNTLSLSFSGLAIHDHNVDGPYIVTGLLLSTSREGFTVDNSDTTQAYSVSNFEGSRISGTVTNANTGTGFENAPINFIGPTSTSTTASEVGLYTKGGLAEGTYQVFAEAPTFFNSDTLTVTVPPDASLDFTLTKPVIDIEIAGINVSLSQGEIISKTFTIANNGSAELNYSIFESLQPSSTSSTRKKVDPIEFLRRAQREDRNLEEAEIKHTKRTTASSAFRASINNNKYFSPDVFAEFLSLRVQESAITFGDSLFYDDFPGANSNFIGLGAPMPLFAAMRFTPESEFELTHVRSFFRTRGTSGPVEILIADHDALNDQPGNIILRQPLGNEFIDPVGKFFLIQLQGRLSFSAGEDFWIIVHHRDVSFPQLATDNGINQAGRSSASGDGITWTPLGDVLGDGNDDAFLIRALSPLDIPWLSVRPKTGTFNLSTGGTLFLKFDATGLSSGTFEASLIVTSNDLASPEIQLPVTLIVVSDGFDITGAVTYALDGITDAPVSDVSMILSGDSTGVETTDADGIYLFENLEGGLNYTVTPSKDNDFDALTISCFDASLALQHSLGLISLTPEQQLAADVDEDSNILAFDASLICRSAIGLPPFNGNDQTGEWRFDPVERSYTPLNSDQSDQDYAATLLGDVDGNWTPAASSTVLAKVETNHINFIDEPIWSDDGKEVTTSLRFDGELQAFSFDLDLNYDTSTLRFIEAICPIEGWTIIENSTESGRLRLGMYSVEPLIEDEKIVHLKWQTIKTGMPTKIALDRALVNREMQSSVEIEVVSVPTKFALHQNYPNPFNLETKIRFDVPKARAEKINVRIAIYNISGQLMRVLLDEERAPGSYEVQWTGQDERGKLVTTGVYFYTMAAGDFKTTKKMLILK